MQLTRSRGFCNFVLSGFCDSTNARFLQFYIRNCAVFAIFPFCNLTLWLGWWNRHTYPMHRRLDPTQASTALSQRVHIFWSIGWNVSFWKTFYLVSVKGVWSHGMECGCVLLSIIVLVFTILGSLLDTLSSAWSVSCRRWRAEVSVLALWVHTYANNQVRLEIHALNERFHLFDWCMLIGLLSCS